MIMNLNHYTLSNGIRIVHLPFKSVVCHCGFVINAGTRDEDKNNNGIAHFIEHAIFKGTKKRKAYHILNRIDNVGGELNAFTTKETTNIYASFDKSYFVRATELLCDILFNATFPATELEKEKEVIIDEINSYKDNPFEQIYDDFEAMIFKNHPLGFNILGEEKTVKKFSSQDCLNFMKTHYLTNQMVFSVAGDISFQKIVSTLENLTAPFLNNNLLVNRKSFNRNTIFKKSITKDVYQAHCVIGNIAYNMFDAKKNGFILLNNILGGPAMNSRLNIGVREKYGFTYNIESSYTAFTDTGLFNIYLGTDNQKIDNAIDIVFKELKKLREKKLTSSQLTISKRQLKGQIVLEEENKCNAMLGIGKSVLNYDKVDDLSTTFMKIDKITATQLIDIANEIFDENKISQLIYKN